MQHGKSGSKPQWGMICAHPWMVNYDDRLVITDAVMGIQSIRDGV